MVQIHVHDVLEDLEKLRSLIIKKKKQKKKKKNRKVKVTFWSELFAYKAQKIIPKVEQSMWSLAIVPILKNLAKCCHSYTVLHT